MCYLDVNSVKTDFLILSSPFRIHSILKLAPVLSQKSRKMHLARTFCSSTAKTSDIDKELSGIQWLESGIYGVESRIQDWLGFLYIGWPITCSLTIVLIQHTSVMKHSEVNIFHSIPVIIADRCSASGMLGGAILSRNSYFVRRVYLRYYFVKHTVRAQGTTHAMNVMESSFLLGNERYVY